jgi:PKD repeat protein
MGERSNRAFISFFIVLLVVSLSAAFPIVNAQEIYKYYTVSSGGDDGFAYLMVEPGNPPQFTEYFFDDDYYVAVLSTSSTVHNWFRFENVDIPRGAFITAARFRIEPYEVSDAAPVQYRFQAFAEDNASAPTDYGDLMGRPKTSAYRDNVLFEFQLDYVRYMWLTEVIQEIVNRPGWKSGNSIVIYASVDEHSFGKAIWSFEGASIYTTKGMPELAVSYYGPTEAPTLVFTWSPSSPDEGQVVSFDASGTADPDGDIAAYEWHFGDGATGSGVNVSHQYASEGSYAVVLTVTDSEGLIHQTVKTVRVSPVIVDSDGDRVEDDADAFPFDPFEQSDSDGDGVGDNGDAFPYDPSEQADSDGDGVGDNGDAFPYDPSKQASPAPVFDTVSVSVVDSATGAPVAGASVSLQIPSSTDDNYSYYVANYAAQLPVVVNGQTDMGGILTSSLETGAVGALTMAHGEGVFTEFIVEVWIEHGDYQSYQGYQRLSVGGQELSLIFEIQARETVPSTGIAKIKVYVKDVDGGAISGAGVTSTSQPGGQSTLTGTTGSGGYVEFEGVEEGSFIFHASADGYVSDSEVLIASIGVMIEKTILLEEKPKGIPGFPLEGMIIGLALGTFMLRLLRQR